MRALVDMAGLPPQAAGTVDAALRPIIDRAYQPGPAPAVNPRDLVQGIRGIPAIAPAIAIPIGSTTGASAATSTAAATAAATNSPRGQRGPGRQQGVVDGPGFATQREEALAIKSTTYGGVSQLGV